MSKRAPAGLALLLTFGLGLAACSQPGGTTAAAGGGPAGGPIRSGGTLTVALPEAPDALDPTTGATFVGRIVFANMCEKLFDIGPGLQVVPQLAAALPKVTGGGTTYTIQLRTGILFNDGTPLNAAAVKTTLDHYLTDPTSARAAELAAIKAVQVTGPDTVRLQLKYPYAPLTSVLADRAGMILSPRQLQKLGSNFAQDPVCVGPFAFKARPSSDQIELVKSRYYYGRARVHLAGVTFTVITQPSVMAANLQAGDVDVASGLAPPQVSQLRHQSGVVLKSVASLGYQGIDINVANSNGAGKPGHTLATPLASHPELREALSLSLSRSVINKVVFDGQYIPACTPISPVSPYAPHITCPGQDLARARQLVKASGVPTPIKVSLIVQADNSEATQLGTLIQSMAQQAGFAVSVQPTEFTTSLSQAMAGSYQTFNIGWSGRLDPDQNITPFWSAASTQDYTGANYPAVLRLISAEQQSTSTAQRKQIFQQLSQALLQENNIIYLYFPTAVIGYRSNVTGIRYTPDSLVRLANAAFTG
jgi:peptide/nickel transport system substrate-binding protein